MSVDLPPNHKLTTQTASAVGDSDARLELRTGRLINPGLLCGTASAMSQIGSLDDPAYRDSLLPDRPIANTEAVTSPPAEQSKDEDIRFHSILYVGGAYGRCNNITSRL
jgi:hypothetical protein